MGDHDALSLQAEHEKAKDIVIGIGGKQDGAWTGLPDPRIEGGAACLEVLDKGNLNVELVWQVHPEAVRVLDALRKGGLGKPA